jgi:acetolactate synthase-1/2/3 large subunit
LGFPDFEATAQAFGIVSQKHLADLFGLKGPRMLVVNIHPDAYLIPQARFGKPIEDQDPPLPRDELKAQMIVEAIT